MRLLFTGASEYLGQQTNANQSLGGLISSSPLPNGTLDEILGSISEKQMSEGGKDTRAFVIVNDTGADIPSSKLFYTNDSNSPISNIRMSIVEVGEDLACDTYYMESISNGQQSPVSASFKDNKGESNAIVMPLIADGAYLGVWIERSVNTYIAGSGDGGLMSCDSMYTRHTTDPVNQIQSLSVIADVADNLDEEYFELNTPRGRFYVWYNTGSGNDPAVVGREGIEVSINTGASAVDIAQGTQMQLQSILSSRGEVTASLNGSVVTIECLSPGAVTPINTLGTGFTSTIQQLGVTKELEKEESITLYMKY